ncbi:MULTISPECIES: TMAO reductase system sensor histidine kinase/response regulator TorS [Pseudomonadati]|uniref:histidine kinase n=1 Tax=Shewanella aestuarii TaxID=1028752 RepID=A0ABT0L107_9GAMM|nr:TMAO reductase system sensor histidine kinase/response regulator TorS [Shewanella aestuarii]MCL1117112.1 TMAO reductase system sensor histidine kinase/response regulator TorS [Shewanella aestuarii]GGN73683.1 histidine kinase [Shewanella aestuarii]
MSALSLSGKSLVGRLMLAFSLLGLLLLLLVSLGSLSLYWVKLADQYLYEEALPASETARQLMQSSNALLDNAQGLERVEEEAQRAFLGRKLSLESTNLLAAIERLNALNVQDNHNNKDNHLALLAGDIIHDLSVLGRQVGARLALTALLDDKGSDLAEAASRSRVLLEAEQAVVDSAILAKLSLAYPQVAGDKQSAHLLDTIIEQDLDIRERLNRALALIHHIALVGQLLQSPEQQLGLNKVLDSMTRVLYQSGFRPKVSGQNVTAAPNNSVSGFDVANHAMDKQIDLMPLELLKGLIRDPVRATELEQELVLLREVNIGLRLQQQYAVVLAKQNTQLMQLTDKLSQLNKSVDGAMKAQQTQADNARRDFLQQLFWAKSGLWTTGVLMFIIIMLVVYWVIYKGIALRLNEATAALSQLSLGNTEVVLDPHGDDELTAMASAIEAFKQKTSQNQALQAELQATASELIVHKASLENTVQARTIELAETNRQLDAEAKGHSAAREMAEQASNAKSLFLATMSHEIRTPLNGLLGSLTLLSHSPLPPAQKQMLALSQYSGTLLQTVLNDILDFSRLEQGKLTNEPRPVALNDLLDEVMAVMMPGAGLAGLFLKLNRQNLPHWVFVDGPKLRQVLFNLLGNAIKFTAKGGIELQVAVVEQQLTFAVIDTGVGISETAMGQLFIAYSAQPNQGRTRGTGLGLAICKELVALMNDFDNNSQHKLDNASQCIRVDSQVGKGSTFSFSLPLVICNQADESSHIDLPKVAPKNLLVIEDNKVNAMVAQGFLAHLGHQSILVESCAEARAVYRQDNAAQFDAIMLDIQLGDGSGIELLAELTQIAQAAQLSANIAAFTAQVQEDDMKIYEAAGFDSVLEKPLNMQALAAWVGVASEAFSTGNHSVEVACTSNMTTLEHDELSLNTTDDTSIIKTEANLPPNAKPAVCLLNEQQITEDLQYLGADVLNEMLSLFKVSSSAQLAALAGLPAHSSDLLHGLKGSSASMGLVALTRRCQQLESCTFTIEEYQALQQLWQDSIDAVSLKLAETAG